MIKILPLAALSAFFGLADNPKASFQPEDALMRADPITLSEADARQTEHGALTFVAGWSLSADHKAFGGLSGMMVKDQKLFGVTDAGYWLMAEWPDASRAPYGATLLRHPDFELDKDEKALFDAEGLTSTLDGGFLVSFEQNHRLEFFKEPGVSPDIMPLPDIVTRSLARNGGLEAITIAPDGTLWGFAERGRDTRGASKAWAMKGDHILGFSVKLPRNYAPTAARILKNGEILIAARSWSIMQGSGLKLLLVDTEGVTEESIVQPRVLATMRPPLRVDNFEALELLAEDDRRLRIALMSDDNFNPAQETLLMVFDVDLTHHQ